MGESIHFHCPACCIKLSVPIQAAGQQGPCPYCHQLILAPDPYLGISACRVATTVTAQPAPAPAPTPVRLTPPPPAPAFQPFQGVSIPATPAPAPVLTPAPPIEAPRRLSWPVLFLVGAMTAILGFAGGLQSAKYLQLPEVTWKAPTPSTPAPPQAPAQPTPAVLPASSPILTQARTTLEQFLRAEDVRSRSAFALSAEALLPDMERYHVNQPSIATPFNSIKIEHCEADSKTTQLLVVFKVFTDSIPGGFTVAVAETEKGWKVDWQGYNEFRDEQFLQFASGKTLNATTFHLIVLPQPSKEANGELSYILTDPVRGREFLASVKPESEAAASLETLTQNDRIATPALELNRRTKPDGSYSIEIVKVIAPNWRPKLARGE